MLVVLLELSLCGWSGAHKAHVALKDIEKLRELIKTGLSYEGSHLGNSWVVLHLEHKALHLILGFQFFFPLLGVYVHGSELVNLEAPSVLADPDL